MISRLNGVGFKGALFHKVNVAAKSFFKLSPHSCVGEQSDRLATPVKLNKNINIAHRRLFFTGKRSEQPCFLYWLSGEIMADVIYNIYVHRQNIT